MTTTVHNLHREKMGPGDVYIGRPMKYGNRYVIGKHGNREECIRKHREDILRNKPLMEEIKRELRHKRLFCFCKPAACHGDVLAEIANGSHD